MASGNFVQSNFQGGEWSAFFQGRTDHAKYRTAMAVCLNGWPLEEGPWSRRPGFEFLATTYKGLPAKLVTFDFSNSTPYTIELTNGWLRMINGQLLVKTNDAVTVASISPDNNALINLSSAVTWATGDQVEFIFAQRLTPETAVLFNRQFTITVVTTTQLTLADPVTGQQVTGTDIGWAPGQDITIARVLTIASPWDNDHYGNVRSIQLETTALLCEPNTATYRLDAIQLPTGPQTKTLINPGAASAVTSTTSYVTTYYSSFTFTPNTYVTDGSYYLVYKATDGVTFNFAGLFVAHVTATVGVPPSVQTGPAGAYQLTANFSNYVGGAPLDLAAGETAIFSQALVQTPNSPTYATPAQLAAGTGVNTPIYARQGSSIEVQPGGIISPYAYYYLVDNGIHTSVNGASILPLASTTQVPVTTATVALTSSVAWQTGDTVQVVGHNTADTTTFTLAGIFQITPNTDGTFTLYSNSPPYAALDPTALGFVITALVPVTVTTETTTPAVVASDFAEFELSQAAFQDGPYLNVVAQSALTPASTGLGVIAFTVAYQTYAGGTVYAIGDHVTDGSADDYISLVNNNVGHTPSSSPTKWKSIGQGIAFGGVGCSDSDVGRHIRFFDSAGDWYWGIITSVSGLNSFSAAIMTVPDAGANGATPGTGIATTDASSTWQLGVYSDTTGYPSGGCYFQGRVWLIGQDKNRVDASVSGVYQAGSIEPISFQPTAQDGTVSDASGLSLILDADTTNTPLWLEPGPDGLIVGTKSGEWLIQASAQNDPITATSVEANRVSKYGCADVLPVRTPLAVVFVQKFARKCFEFLKDVFTGRYTAPNLSVTAKHLAASGIEELGYQEELTPIVWQRCADGSFSGATYRRKSAFTTEDPSFVGWHRHSLGSGRLVERLVVGPSQAGTLDTLNLVTNDATTQVRHLEVMAPFFDEDATLDQAWFVDDARVPVVGIVVTHDSADWMRLYGLWHLNGETVSVFCASLDCGDLPVTGGYVDVPLDQTGGVLTRAALAAATNAGIDYGAMSVYANDKLTFKTVETSATSTILEFTGAYTNISGGLGTYGGSMIVDWFAQSDGSFHGYNMKGGSGDWSTQGFSTWDVTSGRLLLDKNANQVLTAIPGISFGGGDGLGTGIIVQDSKYLYTMTPSLIIRIAKSTLVADHHVSLSSAEPYSMAASVADGSTYVSVATITGNDFKIANMTNSTLVYSGTFTEQFCLLADAPASGGYTVGETGIGRVYGIGTWDTSPPASFLVYRLVIESDTSITQTTVATITPADINPLWTAFYGDGPSGILYDPSDGNVCTFVQNSNGSAALVKIDVTNGTVKWALLTPDIGGPDVMARSLMQVYAQPIPASSTAQALLPIAPQGSNHTLFSFLSTTVNGDSSYYVWQIDLATGTVLQKVKVFNTTLGGNDYQFCTNTYGPNNFLGATTQRSVLFLQCGYSYSSPYNPAPANAAAKAGFSNLWARLDIGLPTNIETIASTSTGAAATYSFPAVVGFTYSSRGQIVRPALPPETMTQTGPGEGKSRRTMMFGALLQNSIGASFGTDFNHLRPVQYLTTGGAQFGSAEMYSGVYWDTLDDTESFEGNLCWQISRPYPTTVCSITQFISGQDR